MNKVPMESQPLVTLSSVIENKSSQTVLEFLSGRFHYLTPEEWRARILDGSVKVNERVPTENQPLRAGDVVSYTTSSWEEPEVNPNYRIVFEDEALVLVSKPSPLPVHAIGAYFQNTLMTILRRDRPEARGWRPVHRLDSETSGLLVLSKDAKTMTALQKQWNLPKETKGTLTPVSSPQSVGKQALSPQGRGEIKRQGSEIPSPLVGEGGVRGALGVASSTFPSPSRGEGQGEGAVDVGLSVPPSSLVGEGRVRGADAVRGVVKTYRAIVFGKFPAGKRLFEGAIGPKVGSKVRMKLMVVENIPPFEKGGSGGNYPLGVAPKPSSTEFELLETRTPPFEKGAVGGNYPSAVAGVFPPFNKGGQGGICVTSSISLVECRPITGRTHQIRVHLEHQGFPIVGDKLYSGDDETFLHFYDNGWDDWLQARVLLPRVALHAYKLEFNHPLTGERLTFEDPLPKDLSDFWNGLL